MINSINRYFRRISKKIILKIYDLLISLRTPFYKFRYLRRVYKLFWKLIAKIFSKELVNKENNEISRLNIKNRDLCKLSKDLELNGYTIFNEFNFTSEILNKHKLIIKNSLNILSIYKENSFYGTKKYLRNFNKKNLPNDYLKNLYNYATNEIFVDIARNYFKEEPILVELNLLVSPVSENNHHKKYEGSQCWHSDFDDTKILKFFIYLDDVNEENGPLQIVKKNITKKLLKNVNYTWGGKKSHDDSIYSGDSNEYSSMISPKGSVVIADTVNCLHRGSRNVLKSRNLLIASFYTKTSFRYTPINWLLPKPFSDFLLPISSPLIQLDKKKTYLDKFALNK